MGRLKLSRPSYNLRNFARIAVVLSTLVVAAFLYLRMSAVPGFDPDQLRDYLQQNELSVGSDVVNDFQQVYLDFRGIRSFLSSGEANHTNPVSSGQYIAWVTTQYGDNQRLVYLYDVINRTTTQITTYGNASQLDISGNHIVWQDSSSGRPEVFYYDGKSVRQIGEGLPSMRPRIQGKNIVYAQALGEDQYQSVIYHAETGESTVIAKGTANSVGWPQFLDEEITTQGPYNY